MAIDIFYAALFLFISVAYFALLLIGSRTRNTTLSTLGIFFFLSHVVGGPHSKSIEALYEFYGTRAIGQFDFSLPSYLQIYTEVSLSFIILFVVVFFLGRAGKAHVLYESPWRRMSALGPPTRLAALLATRTAVCVLGSAAVLMSVVAYELRVGLHGAEEKLLPFKLSGALVYFRGYIIPACLLLIHSRISYSKGLNIFLVACGVLVGIYSGSKGVGLFYVLPVVSFFFLKESLHYKIFAGVICVLIYSIVASSQVLYMQSPGLSWLHQLTVVLSFSVPLENGQSGFLVTLSQAISGIHRFYGFQDAVLGSQFAVEPTARGLVNFLIKGSPSEIMPNVTADLYGLNFQSYAQMGVAIGWVGIATYLYAHSKILWLAFLAYSGALVHVADRLVPAEVRTSRAFEFTLCLILGIIFLSAQFDVLYLLLAILLLYRFLCRLYRRDRTTQARLHPKQAGVSKIMGKPLRGFTQQSPRMP